jgi:hypothetical protein
MGREDIRFLHNNIEDNRTVLPVTHPLPETMGTKLQILS